MQGLLSGRALVRLAGGGFATIWPELTAPEIDLERLIAARMPVSGGLDTSRAGSTSPACSPHFVDALRRYAVGERDADQAEGAGEVLPATAEIL